MLILKKCNLSVLFVFLLCCNSNNANKIDVVLKGFTSSNEKEILCDFITHNDQIENYRCFYPNGTIALKGTIDDLKKINEEYIYDTSGLVKQYNFFNPSGELVYRRVYDGKGGIEFEEGQYFCYAKSNSLDIKKGDTLRLSVYVATPPGCSHKVYGINNKGVYDIFRKKPEKYLSKMEVVHKKVGEFKFPFQVIFNDTVNNIADTSSSHIVIKASK